EGRVGEARELRLERVDLRDQRLPQPLDNPLARVTEERLEEFQHLQLPAANVSLSGERSPPRAPSSIIVHSTSMPSPPVPRPAPPPRGRGARPGRAGAAPPQALT